MGRTPEEITGTSLETALEELHPATFGWALACCGHDRDEAEEVMQEAYVRVLDGRARFDGRSSLKTWVFGVVRRTAAARRRSRWLRALALGRWPNGGPPPPPAASPESALHDSETRRTLRQALSELPRRQREVLHLCFYEDLTLDEASRVLGVSLGSARRHYHRGKERLRQRLAAGRP